MRCTGSVLTLFTLTFVLGIFVVPGQVRAADVISKPNQKALKTRAVISKSNIIEQISPDVNGDETVDTQDLYNFTEAYENEEESADFNRDGEVNSKDYLSFMNAFSSHSLDNSGIISRSCDEDPDVPKAEPADDPNNQTGLPDTDHVGSPNDKGYEAQVIARWDVVPFQTFRNCITIGVVAFHTNGVERIEFSANGGEWVSSNKPVLNNRTGVIEYNVNLDSSDFPDGLVEIRAVAYPKDAGEPRVLVNPFEAEPGMDPDVTRIQKGHYSAFLYANTNRSLDPIKLYINPQLGNGGGEGTQDNPLATIRQAWEKIIDENLIQRPIDIILTKPGIYAIAKPRNGRLDDMRHWITIRPQNGVNRADVSLQSGQDVTMSYPSDQNIISAEPLTVRPNINMLKFSNLTIDKSNLSSQPGGALLYHDNLFTWWDQLDVYQSGGWGDPDPGVFMRTIGGAKFVTNSTGRDSLYCFTNSLILRDSHCEKITGDVFQNSSLVLNSTLNHLDGSILDHHSDVFQYFVASCTGGVENVINYGVFAENIVNSQNLLYNCEDEGFEDMAFVNIFIENIRTTPVQNQPDPTDHLFIMNFGNPGLSWTFRGEDRTNDGDLQRNLHMTNNVLSRVNMPDEDVNEPVQNVSHNHIVEGSEDFPNALTQGLIFPAKNVERGAYGFGGPGIDALHEPGQDLHNIVLRDHEGPLPRGPVSIFEPCKTSDRPIALIAADPLQIGLGQFVRSGDTVELYSNASYACDGEIEHIYWMLDRTQYLGSETNTSATFETDESEIEITPFTVQIPPLYEMNNENRCVLIDGAETHLLSKLFVDYPGDFNIGDTIQVSGVADMPRPLNSEAIYEVTETGSTFIKIRVLGHENIMELKQEGFMCRDDTEEDRAYYNAQTYYIQTVELETHELGLVVRDNDLRYDWNLRPITVLGTSEAGIVAHYDFEFPVETDGDIAVIDVGGQVKHAQWNTDSQDESMGHYSGGISSSTGRAAVFHDDFADLSGDRIETAHFEIPASAVFGLKNFTISFQMKKDEPNEEAVNFIYRHLMLKISNMADGTTTTTFTTYNEDTGTEQETTLAGDTASSDWVHVSLTYNGSEAVLYINDVEVDRKTGISGTLRPENDYMGWPMQVGAAPWVRDDNYRTNSFSGMIDEFKIYNRVLRN